jgi:hypothetical protein
MPICAFCKKTIATVEEAIDAGWEPSFFVPKVSAPAGREDWEEIPAEFCPACEAENLDYADGEFSLKPGRPFPVFRCEADR